MTISAPAWTPFISYWKTQFDEPVNVSSEATLLEKLHHYLLDGDQEKALHLLPDVLKATGADVVAKDCLLPAAQELTERFNNMEMLLPFVLQSAGVLRKAWEIVLPKCTQFKSPAGCIMITVSGDTHEVGKNIVDTLLQAHGFTIHNLGAQITTDQLLEAINTHQPEAVVMSGLLIESGQQMKANIKAMTEAGLKLPIILGGPSLSPQFVLKECRPLSKSPVLHARSAMDTLAYMQGIGHAKAARQAWQPPANAEPQPPTPSEMMSQSDDGDKGDASAKPAPRSQVTPAQVIPSPPFWGVKVVETIALEDIYPFLNSKVLMTGHWGFRRWDKTPEEQEGFIQAKVQPIYDELKSMVKENKVFTPKVVYGYFPAVADGDDVILYDPQDHTKEYTRFTFPRGGKKNICLSDYLIETEGDQKDVFVLQLVTMGEGAAQLDRDLFQQGSYMLYYLYHGFSVEMAEALAEYWHAQIRKELNITAQEAGKVGTQLLKPSAYQGCRYSFGYPACPNLADQKALMDILDGSQIGVTLTDSYMLTPEQSTSALVFHHPEAYYFDVNEG